MAIMDLDGVLMSHPMLWSIDAMLKVAKDVLEKEWRYAHLRRRIGGQRRVRRVCDKRCDPGSSPC